jgi:uncharacterized protein (DUF58 family)
MTRRGAGALVLGVVLACAGLWWRYPGVAGLGFAFVALVVAAVLTVLVPARVRATRSVRPRTVHRLGSCTGTLELTSTSRFAVRLDAVEQVGGSPLTVDVPTLSGGATSVLEYPIPTARRGVLPVGPLVLRRQGLAGLAQARTEVGAVLEVRVVPRVLPVRGLPSGVRRGQVGADERVERGGTDLLGLREYVPGDDLRRLHWATSARTGTLMVREDADPARPHVAVLLDDRVSAYAEADGFEDAVEMAASLLTSAVAAGHPARLLTSSVDVVVEGETDVVMAALAEVALAPAEAVPSVPVRDLDVVAVVSGAGADRGSLLLAAAHAAVGVVLVVDREAERVASAAGGVLVLTGATVEDLIALWDGVVAG